MRNRLRRPRPAAAVGDNEPGDGAAPRIEVSALTKRFGQKTAVDGIDLAVEPGTFLVLLGPSGSGKSTLLRCLAGIERATSGTIRFDSLLVDGPTGHLPPERRDLAMVFQDYALWPHLTAEHNVAFALKRRQCGPDERRRRSRAVLAQVGLSGLEGRYPGQLSGGEQQRVALARALVGRPGLLLFDEPLSNLDADRRERLRVDIGSMVREQGATAVYITHDQAEAFALADVVGVLESGRLVQIGRPEDVFRNPADAFVARFTGLAGELPGRVVEGQWGRGSAGVPCRPGWPAEMAGSGSAAADGQDRRVGVDIGGAVVLGRSLGEGRLQPGQPARVLVRPSALRFAGSRAGAVGRVDQRHAAGTDGPVSEVAAVVRDAAFRGWGYEHVIEVEGGHLLAGVPAEHRMGFASRSTVVLAADGCLVVPDGEPFGTPAGNEVAAACADGREPAPAWETVPA